MINFLMTLVRAQGFSIFIVHSNDAQMKLYSGMKSQVSAMELDKYSKTI